MASGIQHFVADNVISLASVPLIMLYPPLAVQILAGNVIGTLFTCDIDMEKGTYNEIILAKFVNGKGAKKFVTNVQKTITAPYAFFVPHRSWLSHGPLIATLTITLYLWVVYFVGGKVIDYDVKNYYYLTTTYPIGFATICVHHFTHLLMDGGMIIFRGKRVYLFGYEFYKLTTKLFPQVAND